MDDWRLIPQWETYVINPHGEIMRRMFGVRRPGERLKFRADVWGYHSVHLRHDGRSGYFKVHRLVCEVFIGPPPAGKPYVAHWDGNKSNNHVSNLRWVNASENAEDKERHGTMVKGDRHKNSKLTNGEVVEIMNLFRAEKGQIKALAAQFGVSPSVISGIVSRKEWRHITETHSSEHYSRQRTRLTEDDVKKARELFRPEAGTKKLQVIALAQRFGVGYATMWNALHGKSWWRVDSQPENGRLSCEQ